jgi:lysine 6-dehydrogenase
MGFAMVYDLIRSPHVEQVIVADNSLDRLKHLEKSLADTKIVPVELDVSKAEEVTELMGRCNVAIGCVGYKHNYDLLQCAMKAHCHFIDLGGNETVVKQELRLDELVKELDLTVIPDVGLAPGLVSILAVSAAESLDELYEIRMRVGGVPVDPEGPLNYSQVFAIDGLINEYFEDATILRDGKQFMVPSLTDIEKLEFPKPFGFMEAFNTSGGVSTLPRTYRDKVQHLDYKTIRYPGHCAQMDLLKQLGLMESEEVTLASGAKVAPRELLHHMLEKHLPKDEPDVVLLRVIVTGIRERKPVQLVWQCIDYGEPSAGISAMMRMTAFPASIIAQMIGRGDLKERGVLHQELVVPTKLYLAELEGRGIKLELTEQAPEVPPRMANEARSSLSSKNT